MSIPLIKTPNGRHFELQKYLSVLLIILSSITGLILAVIGYHMMVDSTSAHLKSEVKKLTETIKREVTTMVRSPAQHLTGTMARSPLTEYKTLAERLAYLPLLRTSLDAHPILSGISIGYENGDSFTVRRLPDEDERRWYGAPPQSAYVVINGSGGIPLPPRERLFYDANLNLLARGPSPRASLNSRTRPWFRSAMQADGQVEIAPIFLFGPRQPGMVFSEKSPNGTAVAAVDILLNRLSTLLKRELPTPSSRLVLLGPDGTLLADAWGPATLHGIAVERMHTVKDLAPVMRMGVDAYLAGQRGQGIEINDGERDWEISIEEIHYTGQSKNALLLAVPRDDLLTEGMHFLWNALLGLSGVLLFSAPLIWLAARRISRPLRTLAERAGHMHDFLNGENDSTISMVTEIHDLAGNMNHLQKKIREILEINRALSAEQDFDQLLRQVLRQTISIAEVDGSMTLFQNRSKEGYFIECSTCWTFNGEETTRRFSLNDQALNLHLASYEALQRNVIILTSLTREDSRSHIVGSATIFTDPEVIRLDTICLPLRNRTREPLGTLTLFRAIRRDDEGFLPLEILFIEELAASVAIALENNTLIKSQNDLRDALIRIMADAIDAKSPHTGGHCQRVPELFQKLLEAACQADSGPFENFSLNEDGWEEARLAGWLHDCGKVTTPEYVMDKATKLETLHDRIHEIRTRFEVLKRDAEIASLRFVLAGADPEVARQELEKTLRALDEDFAFVASCNTGGESMRETDLDRLTAIGQRTWLRTLDKRLGISRDELARMEKAGTQAPPTLEALLMDNPEHIIERGEKDMLPADNPWGFRLDMPEALYNRGERYNLSISRGTLTPEERYKINDHITRTIIMLGAMPLPEHLHNVPEIAGAHHETMDGKGYPKKLSRKEMSWAARMMAVADIFEALTAWDRPYKPSNTVKEALAIMESFRQRNHIDPDVYELFLKAGIPQWYAAQFLKPEQDDLKTDGSSRAA